MFNDSLSEYWKEQVRTAVAAERERCAVIAANRWRTWRDNCLDDMAGIDACDDIATAIKGTKT